MIFSNFVAGFILTTYFQVCGEIRMKYMENKSNKYLSFGAKLAPDDSESKSESNSEILSFASSTWVCTHFLKLIIDLVCINASLHSARSSNSSLIMSLPSSRAYSGRLSTSNLDSIIDFAFSNISPISLGGKPSYMFKECWSSNSVGY